MEQWSKCSDFPSYEVSSAGRVRRTIIVRGKQPVILKPWKNSKGYDVVRLREGGQSIRCMVHRLVAKEFFNIPDDLEVDHKYQDLEDYSQLRAATRAQNARNARGQQNHTSNFKGVSWAKARKLWYACIAINGTVKNLGRYVNERDAALAYDRAAKAAWGEFAFLNFPEREHALSAGMDRENGQ